MTGFNLSAWAVRHPALVLFLIACSVVGGIVSYLQLGRAEDPAFDVPMMTAIVVWPGATAQQVQDEVMDRMEDRLRELDGFDHVRSFSRPGYGGLLLELRGGLSRRELDAAWYQARKKIGDARGDFPAGVQGPYFNDEYSDVYMTLYALRGDGLTEPELLEIAHRIRIDLQGIGQVAKVDVIGAQKETVDVDVSSRRLAALGVPPSAIADALARRNMLGPAGSVDTASDRVYARVDGALRGPADVADVLVPASGGHLLRLGDIARVRAGLADPPSLTVRRDGHPVLTIGVTMAPHADVLALGAALDRRVAAIRATLPAGLSLDKYADQPRIVADSIGEFEASFLEALAIVLAVSFIALGRRAGVVVAASVPLVLGIVLIVMNAGGWGLDRVSLGSLIIALGLLVDDAIIAVEMMVVKMEQGWDRIRAATFAYTSTAFPMLTGTMVTLAGFMPVGFAKSLAGQYAGGIFWVVGIALVSSWMVAVVFTPYLGVVLLPGDMRAGEHGDPYATPFYDRLRRGVELAVEHRWRVLGGVAALFVLAAAAMALVQQQFFPTASRPELLVELRLKNGASFAATARQVGRLEQLLARDPDVRSYTAYTGGSSPRFYMSLAPELPDPGYAEFVIDTAGVREREAVRARLTAVFAQGRDFPELRAHVSRLEFGPPVGFPVQFRVIGPDPDRVRAIAWQVRDIVRRSPLVHDTQLDWDERVRTVGVRVDQAAAARLGLSTADVQRALQTSLSGAKVTEVVRGNDVVDVVLRADRDERRGIADLGGVMVFSPTAGPVPLSAVARMEPRFEDPVLWRWNRRMAITVRSDVVDGVQAPDATTRIWPSLQPVLRALPPGYAIEQGGAIEESAKANVALYAVFPAMLATMLLFLMMQLQSFSRVAMVFMTAPLGLIGVVPALLVCDAPFGFVALLGVIALGGMIMRNSVILVDQIDRDIAEGKTPWQAIVDATARRTRPVLLTAAAAILAMIPLSRSEFWGPMAVSIMGGLVVATALTLGFVPALYATWFGIRRDTPAREPRA